MYLFPYCSIIKKLPKNIQVKIVTKCQIIPKQAYNCMSFHPPNSALCKKLIIFFFNLIFFFLIWKLAFFVCCPLFAYAHYQFLAYYSGFPMIKFVLWFNVMGLEGDTRPHVFCERSFRVFHTLTLTLSLHVRTTFLPSYYSKMPVGKCKSNADDTDHQRKTFFMIAIDVKFCCVVAMHEYTYIVYISNVYNCIQWVTHYCKFCTKICQIYIIILAYYSMKINTIGFCLCMHGMRVVLWNHAFKLLLTIVHHILFAQNSQKNIKLPQNLVFKMAAIFRGV